MNLDPTQYLVVQNNKVVNKLKNKETYLLLPKTKNQILTEQQIYNSEIKTQTKQEEIGEELIQISRKLDQLCFNTFNSFADNSGDLINEIKKLCQKCGIFQQFCQMDNEKIIEFIKNVNQKVFVGHDDEFEEYEEYEEF